MMDIDYFHNKKDCFGHCARRSVVKRISNSIGTNLFREQDSLEKYSGESPLIQFSETAHRWLEIVFYILFQHIENKIIPQSMSSNFKYVFIIFEGDYYLHIKKTEIQLLDISDIAIFKVKQIGSGQYSLVNMAEVYYD